MPSGFQQDNDQLQPNFYRVAIDMSSGTYYPTTTSGNTGGGVTPNSSDSFTTANLPSTLLTAQNRARGNMRFRNVVNRLSGLTDCQILDLTITEANADAQATSLTFTVKFERDTFIPLTGQLQGGVAVGNDIAGNAMDTVAKAVANAVASGIRDATTANVRVYNPTAASDDQLSITVAASGTAAQTLGTVTVTLIDTTTLVNA
jgi:hypothetical protein